MTVAKQGYVWFIQCIISVATEGLLHTTERKYLYRNILCRKEEIIYVRESVPILKGKVAIYKEVHVSILSVWSSTLPVFRTVMHMLKADISVPTCVLSYCIPLNGN